MITTYTYDKANRLKLANAGGSLTTYTVDAAGNRTSKQTATETIDYTWDAPGRMVTADVTAGTVTFTYNADGQRTAKQSTDASVTGYLYDYKKLLAETDDVGGDVATLYATTTDQEFGDLIGEDGESVHQYDAQANTNALLDTSGQVEATYKYYAFGDVASFSVEQDAWTSLTVDQWATMSIDDWAALPLELSTNMLAGGKKQYYLDRETELYLLGTGTNGRYYDASTGKFLSEDPIRQASSDPNLLAYVENNPVNNLDPSGHDAAEDEKRRREEEERRRREEEAKRQREAAARKKAEEEEQKNQQNPQYRKFRTAEDERNNLKSTLDELQARKDKAHAAGDSNAEKALWGEMQTAKMQFNLRDMQARREFTVLQGGKDLSYFDKGVEAAQKEMDKQAQSNLPTVWEMTKAYASGAAEGAKGGASIVANTISYGATDKLHVTNSDQYQGKAYTAARISATIGREALVTAATLGVGAVARGGVEGASISAQVINAAAESKQLVQAARIVNTGLTVYNAGNAVVQTGQGIRDIAKDPKDWHGYVEAGAGVVSGALTAHGVASELKVAKAAATEAQAVTTEVKQASNEIEQNAGQTASKAVAAPAEAPSPPRTVETAPAEATPAAHPTEAPATQKPPETTTTEAPKTAEAPTPEPAAKASSTPPTADTASATPPARPVTADTAAATPPAKPVTAEPVNATPETASPPEPQSTPKAAEPTGVPAEQRPTNSPSAGTKPSEDELAIQRMEGEGGGQAQGREAGDTSKPPVIGEVRPYNEAKTNRYAGYDDHHLDPPLGRTDPNYKTGPTIPVRNDNAGGKVAGGLNVHTGEGGFQQALNQHIKDLGFTKKTWNALSETTRLTHLKRYYSSLGLPFPG